MVLCDTSHCIDLDQDFMTQLPWTNFIICLDKDSHQVIAGGIIRGAVLGDSESGNQRGAAAKPITEVKRSRGRGGHFYFRGKTAVYS